MPHRKEKFINGEIYHVILRAIDDNLIFKDIDDYYRGIYSVYEFNNFIPVSIRRRREERKQTRRDPTSAKLAEVGSRRNYIDPRDKFVEVFAFCFMPNHIHLLLRQVKENGISKFMQKVGGGYGRYFNDKYHRKGYVFQNRFKSVHIKDNNQFMVVVPYIFTNPIALIEQGWKEQGIRNHSAEEVMEFLKGYKWSSYQDCLGIKNFPSVTQRDFLLQVMGDNHGCEDAVKNWIMYKKEVGQYANLFLE